MSMLALSGRNGWHRMAATPEEQAGQVRRVVLDIPENRFTTDRVHRDRQLLAAIHGRFPEMVEELGAAAILALTRTLEDGACSWCAAAQIAGHDLEETPARRAALGSMCGDCRGRRDAAESADAESAHLRELTAAGLSPASAGRLRTPQAIRRQAEGIKRLRESPLPTAPTGVITAAGGRRVPDPPYYRRRPVRWPAEARRAR